MLCYGKHSLRTPSILIHRDYLKLTAILEWMHAIESTIRHLHESDDGRQHNKQLPFLKNIEAMTTSLNQTNGAHPTDSTNRSQSSRPLTADTSSGTSTPRSILTIPETSMSFYEAVRNVPGNRACADCGNSDAKWASINLGVGLLNAPHTHISKSVSVIFLGRYLHWVLRRTSFAWRSCIQGEVSNDGRPIWKPKGCSAGVGQL